MNIYSSNKVHVQISSSHVFIHHLSCFTIFLYFRQVRIITYFIIHISHVWNCHPLNLFRISMDMQVIHSRCMNQDPSIHVQWYPQGTISKSTLSSHTCIQQDYQSRLNPFYVICSKEFDLDYPSGLNPIHMLERTYIKITHLG